MRRLVSFLVLASVVSAPHNAAHAGFMDVTIAGPGGTGQRTFNMGDNVVFITKDFTSLNPINVTFKVDAGGEYQFAEDGQDRLTPGIKNDVTATAWDDFHWILINPVANEKIAGATGMTSIMPFKNSDFGNGGTTFTVFGGILPSGQSFGLSLFVDVPSAGTYTMEELPSVAPEPSSLTLLGLGLASLAGYGWRRRKQSAA